VCTTLLKKKKKKHRAVSVAQN